MLPNVSRPPLFSDLQGKNGGWVNDLDERNRVIMHLHGNHFHWWNALKPFDPVIFEDDFSIFHVTHFEPAEGGFDFTAALKKPAEGLIHFHQMHGTDASIEGYQARNGLQTLNGRRVKRNHGADIIEAKIVSDLFVA